MTPAPSYAVCIPAKSTSRRLPGKNFRLLHGVPMYLYTVYAAVDARLIGAVDRVIVSTDEPERVRSEIPFELHQYVKVVGREVVKGRSAQRVTYETLKACGHDVPGAFAVQMLPTSPFRRVGHVLATLMAAEGDPHGRAMTVVDGRRIMRKYVHVVEGEDDPWVSNGAVQVWPMADREMGPFRHYVQGMPCAVVPMGAVDGLDIDTPEDWMLAEAAAARGQPLPRVPSVGTVSVIEMST